MIDKTLNILINQAIFQDIEVKKDFDPDTPTMVGDLGQLQQVFTNLFINAADAMEGKGRLGITARFDESRIYNIVSHDCNKSIPLININNQIEMPHLKFADYTQLQECARHCDRYRTMLRYFDLNEIVQFIHYIDEHNYVSDERYKISTKYEDLTLLTMNNIKIHYLELLQKLTPQQWSSIYEHFQSIRKTKFDSNIHIATKDAHTLVDGPSIFLADDVEKISKFVLQSIKIPEVVISNMMEAMDHNDKVLEVLKKKERTILR